MPKLRSYDFRCKDCPKAGEDVDFDEIVVVDEEGNMQTLPACPECGQPSVKVPSAPRVMKESWPDGRRRGDSWYIAKEAAKLRRESFKKHPSKREELKREIKKLESESHKRFKDET